MPGGRASTDERRGFRFNQGAHAVYLGGSGAGVLARLGVTHRGHTPPPADVHGFRGDVIAPLPVSVGGMVRSPLAGSRGKAQLARFLGIGVHRIDPRSLADRSAEAWLEELPLRSDARAIVRTFTRVATFTNHLDGLSADAAARQLQLAVRPGVSYIDGGWQTLVDGTLGAALAAGVDVRTHHLAYADRTRRAGLRRAHRWRRDDRDSRRRGHHRRPVPAGRRPDCCPIRRRGPASAKPSTVACLDLGASRVPSSPIVFGIERPLYLSTHCPPGDLAPNGHAVVHLMRYGATTADADRAELADLARRAGLDDDDIEEQRFLARMTVTHAVPVPGEGLRGRPRIDSTGTTGVFIAGDWVGPDGMLSDATLGSAETAAHAAARHVARVAA